MALIEYKNFCFRYALAEQETLHNINIKIDKGEMVLVTGASGCGKTTLLSMIKKSIMPNGESSGMVTYKGEDIKNIAAFQIGYVGQYPQDQIVTDKVWHEIAFGLENLGYENVDIRKKTAETAEYFGMSKWYRMDTFKLSGGQKQLLNLASIMAMNPEVLVLDEPTAQLDPIAAQKFIDMLVRLNRELGITILISEHRTEQLFSICDKIITMKEGSVVYQGTPVQVALSIIKDSQDSKTLPTAAKIYYYVNASLADKEQIHFKQSEWNHSEQCPLTVREGRNWIDTIYNDAKQWVQKNENNSKYKEDFKGNELYKDYLEKEDLKKKDWKKRAPYHLIQNEKSVYKQNNAEIKNKIEYSIHIQDVSYCYGKKEDLVVENLNLDVAKGQFLAITGGNGAGKTTILKLISGVLKPVLGKIKVYGKCIFVSQNPKAMFTEISVEEELAEVLSDSQNQWTKKMSREDKIKEVEKMLEKTRLDKVRKYHPYDISGGQQQKLAIAKGLLFKPDILLLDEPTKGLDPSFKEELGTYIQHLIETQKLTVVMVSHDLDFCAEYASECALMFDRSIVSKADAVTFFEQNNYYTTAATKIASGYIKSAVTYRQVGEKLKNFILQ